MPSSHHLADVLIRRADQLEVVFVHHLQGYRTHPTLFRAEELSDITQTVLSARLKELEREGLVENRVDSSIFPVKSEYTLARSGLEIIGIIKDMKRWALKWKIDNIECSCQDCSEYVL